MNFITEEKWYLKTQEDWSEALLLLFDSPSDIEEEEYPIINLDVLVDPALLKFESPIYDFFKSYQVMHNTGRLARQKGDELWTIQPYISKKLIEEKGLVLGFKNTEYVLEIIMKREGPYIKLFHDHYNKLKRKGEIYRPRQALLD